MPMLSVQVSMVCPAISRLTLSSPVTPLMRTVMLLLPLPLEDELLELLELLELELELAEPPPSTARLARLAVALPLAQKPKLVSLPGAMLALWAAGVTLVPLRLPFHKLVMLEPFRLRSTVQLVMLALPLLATITSAQYPAPHWLETLSVASPEPSVMACAALVQMRVVAAKSSFIRVGLLIAELL